MQRATDVRESRQTNELPTRGLSPLPGIDHMGTVPTAK